MKTYKNFFEKTYKQIVYKAVSKSHLPQFDFDGEVELLHFGVELQALRHLAVQLHGELRRRAVLAQLDVVPQVVAKFAELRAAVVLLAERES